MDINDNGINVAQLNLSVYNCNYYSTNTIMVYLLQSAIFTILEQDSQQTTFTYIH